MSFQNVLKNLTLVIICPLYAAGEKKKENTINKFAKLIGKNSKTQVIIVQNLDRIGKIF